MCATQVYYTPNVHTRAHSMHYVSSARCGRRPTRAFAQSCSRYARNTHLQISTRWRCFQYAHACVWHIRSEKHLTRIGAVNDAFRKRRENVRVGQHLAFDNGGSLVRLIEHQIHMYDVASSLSSLLEPVTCTDERKGRKD